MSKRIAVWMWVIAAAAACGPVKPPASTPVEEPVPPGSVLVDPPAARYVAELDLRERREQVRDWAVFATVAHRRASADAAAAATYELPPARLPYLDELYSFEHGRGRRIYLDGRVLLFRDADDPEPHATLGRLADRVRMENGEVPPTVEVYAVHAPRSDGAIRIDRLPDATRDELFSPAYGYVEGEATDPASLAAWLDRTDDLTVAQLTADGRLALAGRRFGGARTQNLTLDDVAALYQAHDELEQPRARAAKWLSQQSMRTRISVERVIDLVKQGKGESYDAWTEMYSIAVPASEHDNARAAIGALGHERSPGFSLDPRWLPDPANPRVPHIVSSLRTFIATPCDELHRIAGLADTLEAQEPDPIRPSSRTSAAVELRRRLSEDGPPSAEVCEQIHRHVGGMLSRIASSAARLPAADWDLAQAALHQVQKRLDAVVAVPGRRARAIELSQAAIAFYEADTSVQCGTYFGLRGTRVGMTLFYTDLLMKLWSMDYGHSAPTSAVPGFVAAPFVELPDELADEIKESGYTRMWFGPRADALSRATTGTEEAGAPALIFDHRFTRIYAAGSGPGRVDIETQPIEYNRRTIGWWDQHFDEVADFEQEYHRQNQIMKWAVVTAALASSSAGDYLKQVRVDRSLAFRTWYAASRDRLRFNDPLPIPPRTIAGEECLPLLSSSSVTMAGSRLSFTGGVATVTRRTVARAPAIRASEQIGLRRPYVADLGAGTSGTSARVLPTRSGPEVTFYNAGSARTRAATGEIKLGTPSVRYEGGGAAALEIRAGAGEHAIGVLGVEAKSASRVQLRWTDDVVEAGRREISLPGNLAAADKLAATGRLGEAAQVYARLGASAARTADDLARQVIVDTARRRPGPVLQTLQQLESKGVRLAPQTRSALEHAVSEIGTPAASAHVSAALRAGRSLATAEGRLVVERGRLIVTREIDRLPVSANRTVAKDLSNAEVYIDSRLRVAREGLLTDLGPDVARWRARPDVTFEMLDRSAIGALPDQLVVRSTKVTLDRVVKTIAGTAPPLVLVIREAARSGEDDHAPDATVAR